MPDSTSRCWCAGTVPGGTAAAARVKYRAAVSGETQPVYYGRVVRRDGWIVLQYLFFYFMNDWRSTFGGANDHEADWEQMFVYLEEAADGPGRSGSRPRRTTRWATTCADAGTTPSSRSEGDHPILYPGAGSHATYFEPASTSPRPAARPGTHPRRAGRLALVLAGHAPPGGSRAT